jgi:hypothetical protein
LGCRIAITMNSIEYTYRGAAVRVELAASWNELSSKQLLAIAKHWTSLLIVLRSLPPNSAVELLNAARIDLLIVLSGINRWNSLSRNTRNFLRLLPSRRMMRKHRLNSEFLEEYEHLPNMLKCADFLFEKVTLTKNLLPVIKAKKYTLHGPAESLSSMVAKEFVFADVFFIAYKKSLSIDDLNLLVAVLYRPGLAIKPTDAGFSGDYRIPFNNMAIDEWMDDVKALPEKVKVAVALFYEGCRSNLEKLYPAVFAQKENTSGDNEASWFSLISELPAEKFGTLIQRETVNIDIIFSELNLLLKKMEKQPSA